MSDVVHSPAVHDSPNAQSRSTAHVVAHGTGAARSSPQPASAAASAPAPAIAKVATAAGIAARTRPSYVVRPGPYMLDLQTVLTVCFASRYSSVMASAPRVVRKARTQQERRDQTRGRILDAAVESLIEAGVAGTTTLEVQKRADVSRGALLHHFPSKA